MAIHNQAEKEMQAGNVKSIDESANEMVFDLLQKYQYNSPIKSTVRELVSNALDSISDREVARKILLEGAPVSDFFVEKEGKEFVDSKFDPDYYHFDWLSNNNTVNVTYIVGPGMERDKVVITDEGVGLGTYRLEKYFRLGYSTKRLSKLPLGKFGIGGKAALSVGEEFFTMESRYDGHKFRFNIYSHTFDSLIPPFNLDTGIENGYVLFYEGTPREVKIYYEDTKELNGVIVTVGAKKTHRQQYIDAVKSQLLYFQNINFQVIDESGIKEIDYKARILYEDDLLILSDNAYFDKPHILVNKVNYGYINFAELELEDKLGNIGIKVASEDIDLHPSRESIVWNEITKKTILDRFNQVVEVASKFIQDQLHETDYLTWIRACYNIIGKSFAESTIVGRLAKIVDISNVKPSFIPEPKLRFQQNKVFNGLNVREVQVEVQEVAQRRKYKLKRDDVNRLEKYINLPVYLMKYGEKANNRKDKWLFQQHPDGFLLIAEPWSNTPNGLKIEGLEGEQREVRIAHNTTWKYLTESRDITWYDTVEVPGSFTGTDEEVDEEDLAALHEQKRKARVALDEEERKARDQQLKIARNSVVQRRKALGKILVYTPRGREISSKTGRTDDGELKVYEWQKLEVPISDMNNWEANEIYYAVGPETDKLMNFVAMLSRDPYEKNLLGRPIRYMSIKDTKSKTVEISLSTWKGKKWYRLHGDMIRNYGAQEWDAVNCQHFFDNNEIMLVKTSMANARYMEDFQPIQQFFHVIRNKTITMSNLLVRWNTARLIRIKLNKANFLYNYGGFNPMYTKLYAELCTYVDYHYRDVEAKLSDRIYGLDRVTYGDLIKHMDKVQQFQDFVVTKPTDDEVAQIAQELFGNNQLKDGQAIEPEMMAKLSKVMEYVEAVGVLFNYIPILTGGVAPRDVYTRGAYKETNKVPEDLEMELKQYLDMKGLLDYGRDEEDFAQFQQEIESGATLVEEITEEHEGGYLPAPIIQAEIDANDERGLVEVLKPDQYKSNDLEIPGDQAIMQEF